MSISNYLENKWLEMLRGTAFTAPAATYLKLHIGDPGEAGTANAAAEATRKVITFAAESGGVLNANGTLPAWTNVAATEVYSHGSLWDALTVGNCLGSGPLSSTASVAAGDSFAISAFSYTLD